MSNRLRWPRYPWTSELRVVYGLVAINDPTVRYVGATRKLANRLSSHKSLARVGTRGRLYDWIRSVGCEIDAVVIDEAGSLAGEAREIRRRVSRGEPLLNLWIPAEDVA